MNKMKNTILVVDSDPQSLKMMSLVLDENDFTVVMCPTGKQATRFTVSIKPDLILMDTDLKDMPGIDLISSLREWSEVPIIILSARIQNSEVIEALDLGANDYVFKPFNADVLMARINASLRSSAIREAGEPQLINGPLRIDLVRHEVFLDEELLPFTPKEYKLLRYFMIHRGKMLHHREILKDVWGESHSDDIQYLRVFVSQIREKIDHTPNASSLIMTEPGIGYRMDIVKLLPSSEPER